MASYSSSEVHSAYYTAPAGRAKIEGQTVLSILGVRTVRGNRNLFIQTSCTLLKELTLCRILLFAEDRINTFFSSASNVMGMAVENGIGDRGSIPERSCLSFTSR